MSDDSDDESDNYKFIRTLMTTMPLKPMLVKYDADGDGSDPQGSRKMWPMVLGHSPDSDLSDEQPEMVLCYQTTGSPQQRGWRCFKVGLLINPTATNPNQARPNITEDDVRRQNCVTDVELPPISSAKAQPMPPQDNYQVIHDAIVNGDPIAAKYKGKNRKLWPVVLGESPKPGSSGQKEKMLLGFEFELDGVAHSPPVWRCYKVKLFGTPTPTSTSVTKPVLSQDEINRQSCVLTPDPTLP